MGRIDGQRRQHRQDVVREDRLGRRLVRRAGDIPGVEQPDPGDGQFAADLDPDALLVGHQMVGLGVDLAQLLAGGKAVLAQHPHAFADLAFETGDADHVELVKVVGRDGEETQALQQRVPRIDRLFQHPPVKG